MTDYSDGVGGQAENEAYCMKKSFQAKNVDSMNEKMGYNNMSDLANTPKAPTKMMGAKSNPQLGAKASNSRYDY
jgi:hypothetical protein